MFWCGCLKHRIKMIVLLVLLFLKFSALDGKLFGDHVCRTEITEPKEILQWELQNRTIRTYQWCLHVPPRCSVYSTKVYNTTKFVIVNETRSVETCCEGFQELNSYCISLCQNCKNGLCLKGECICQNGWIGTNCDDRVQNFEETPVFTTKTLDFSTTNPHYSYINDKISTHINTESTTTQNKDGQVLEESTTNLKKNTLLNTTNLDELNMFNPTLPVLTSTNLDETISNKHTTTESTTTQNKDAQEENTTILMTTTSLNTENLDRPNISKITFPILTSTTSVNHLVEQSDRDLVIHSSTNHKNSKDIHFQTSTKSWVFDTVGTRKSDKESTIILERENITSTKINTLHNDLNYLVSTTAVNKIYDTDNKILKVEYKSVNDIAKHLDSTTKSVSIDKTREKNTRDSFTEGRISTFTPINTQRSFDTTTLKSGISPNLFSENYEIDYREIGGQSLEDQSEDFPKVMQNIRDKNQIYFNQVPAETSTRSLQETTLLTTSVLDKPIVLKNEEENSILKDHSIEELYDFTEEKYQKRSSLENYGENTLLNNNRSSDINNNLLYSVCAATVTTLLLLILAVAFFAIRNAKAKVERNKKEKNDAAAVAVFRTSIFHSPLPDPPPPTFDNPTYITGVKENWEKQNTDMIEIQEFNVVFQKPTLKNPKLDCKQYLYDHPPSTGSYRASSDVDALSHYNFSNMSSSGIILEPVYDEIPTRDYFSEKKSKEKNVGENDLDDVHGNTQNYVDNNSVYVNTFGRTVF